MRFIDDIIKGEIKLERDTCVPITMILSDECFIQHERREQVKYE